MTTSATAVGPSRQQPTEQQPSTEQIDAINQVFALFRLNYHNQFYAAYPDSEQVQQVKKLWLDALAGYRAEHVLRGARHVIETSEYLPTLHRMLEACQTALRECGLPTARAAYMEACQAAAPQSAQTWSHAAVYLAGRDAGWFLLNREPEQKSWPIFQQCYRDYCARVMAGETLELPLPNALPDPAGRPCSRREALAELAKIKAALQG